MNEPAFPYDPRPKSHRVPEGMEITFSKPGLTKLEYASIMAMQSFLNRNDLPAEEIAKMSIYTAKKLIKKLENES